MALSNVFFRIIELILAVVGLIYVYLPHVEDLFAVTIGDLIVLSLWVALAITYLVAGALALRIQARRADDEEAKHAPVRPHREVLGSVTWLLPYVTSLVGVIAAFTSTNVKTADSEFSSMEKMLFTIIGAAAMICSWGIMHAGFARSYERFYLREGGLLFPGTEHPRAVDFVYFSFTIGSSFAVSDVQTTTRRMRIRVLGQSVLSFFYNAAIVALAIAVITGK